MSDELLKLKEKEHLTREQAAARLRAIAHELGSGNDIVFDKDGVRFVAKVPDHVELNLEFEVDEDESEFEIELTWTQPNG